MPIVSFSLPRIVGWPHISLVFCEMWETMNLDLFSNLKRGTWSTVVSHISQKTSEIWGTPRFLEGKERNLRSATAPSRLDVVC